MSREQPLTWLPFDLQGAFPVHVWSGRPSDFGNKKYVVFFLSCAAILVSEFHSRGNECPIALPWVGVGGGRLLLPHGHHLFFPAAFSQSSLPPAFPPSVLICFLSYNCHRVTPPATPPYISFVFAMKSELSGIAKALFCTWLWFSSFIPFPFPLCSSNGPLWLPLWLSWLRILLQCGRPGFDSWVGKIPWRREGLPTPVFWPGEFHGLYSPWCHKEDWATFPFTLGPFIWQIQRSAQTLSLGNLSDPVSLRSASLWLTKLLCSPWTVML